MLAQALLGVEKKADRLDRLYGLHLVVIGSRLACLRVHVTAKAPRAWRPFPAASSMKLSLEAESMLPFFR
jgi:hypothetical protein